MQESSVETQTITTYDDGVPLNNGAGPHSPERPETQTDPLRGPRRRGPKTQAGKARVSTNALTHGIVSVRVILPCEASIEWETHRKNIIEALAPVGPLEAALAERVAAAIWRLKRVTAYEEATTAERQELPTVSARLLPHPLELDKIIRYEAHLSRQLYQALHELEAMRAQRRGQPAPLVRVDVHGPNQLDAPDRSAA